MKKEKQAEVSQVKSVKGQAGGQALIEGIMMRGVTNAAMAVRLPTGEIDVEEWELNKPSKITKIPFIRGIINFISSLVMGYKCLTKSAEKAGLEEVDDDYVPSKFENFIEKKFGDNLMKIVVVLGVVLGVAAAIALFMLLPSVIVKGIDMLVPLGGFKALIEGVIKIIIFIVYLAIVSNMKDIHRVFEYHGAEHKTIFCYEAGEELTIENVKKFGRFHPRCGTSFMILILIISILIFSVVTWSNVLVRVLLKLALLPVVLGIAYEIIKFAGRHDNWLTRAISWPGVMLQHLTTKEPDDSQIEVAIEALKPCIGLSKAPEKEKVKEEKTIINAKPAFAEVNHNEN